MSSSVNNITIIKKFIDAINCADIEKIYGLMTKDHLFIDSQNNKVKGKIKMREAWQSYFTIFPDYKIEINKVFEKESEVCILGYASGTYKGIQKKEDRNFWKIPLAISASVIKNKVQSWQVYADNSIVFGIIKRNK